MLPLLFMPVSIFKQLFEFFSSKLNGAVNARKARLEFLLKDQQPSDAISGLIGGGDRYPELRSGLVSAALSGLI